VKRHHRAAPLAVLLALALTAGTAAAGEGHGTDLFAGYSFASIGEASRHGGNLAVGFDLGPISGFVDTSFHWGSQSAVSLSDLTLMAGPGARFGTRGATVFFVRALAGLVRDRTSIGIFDVDISESTTGLGFMGGGGVDYRVASKLAVRLQADYLFYDAGGVVRLVLRGAAGLLATGVAIGIGTSLLAAGLVGSLLYGLEPRDPLTLAVATGVLVVVGLLAAGLPARRASRIDPAEVLREG